MTTQNFENHLKKLEQLVKELESDLPLEQALTKFKEGVELASLCQTRLQEAEQEVTDVMAAHDLENKKSAQDKRDDESA